MDSFYTRATVLLHSMLLIAVLGMAACGDDPTEPIDRSFSLQLSITNREGDPVSGLRISAWSRLPSHLIQDEFLLWDGSKPATTFRFELADTSRVAYRLYDVSGEMICTLADGIFPADVDLAVWNGWSCDLPGSPPAISGAYRAVFEARDPDTDELLHTDEIVAVLYLGDPEQTILGYADDAGEFTTTWKQFFPHLYDWEPFIAVDEAGNPLGTFSYLDQVRITLTDTTAQQSQSFDVVVEDGPNSFTLTWDPVKAHSWQYGAEAEPIASQPRTPTARQASGPSLRPMPAAAKTRSDQPPPSFRILQNYPNPFN